MTNSGEVQDGFLAKLLQKTSIGIAVFDKETLSLRWNNEFFAKLCSLKSIAKRKPQVGYHFLDFFFSHDVQGMEDLVRIAIEQGTAFDNRRYLLKGERAHFPADIRLFVFSEDSGKGCIALEVTSLSQQITMEKSEFKRQKLESVLEALSDGILVLTPDLHVSEESSKQVERILGRHDIVGKTFSEIFGDDTAKVDGGLEAWEITLRSVFLLLLPAQAHDLLASAPTHMRYRASREREEKFLKLSYAPIVVKNAVAGLLVSLGEQSDTPHQHDRALTLLKGTRDVVAACRIAQELLSESLADAVQRFVQRNSLSMTSLNDYLLGIVFRMAGLPDIAEEVERAKAGDGSANEYLHYLQEGLQYMLPTPGHDAMLDIAEGILRVAKAMGLHVEVSCEVDAAILGRDRTRASRLLLLLSLEALATRIERESARLSAGKPTPANIKVRVDLERDKRIVMSFEDDGSGYDLGLLVAKAIQEKAIADDVVVAHLGENVIRNLIVEKGLYPTAAVIPMVGQAATVWKLIREQMPEVTIESLGRAGKNSLLVASWISR